MVSGRTIKLMALESLRTLMALSIEENGKTIFKMVKVKKLGQMVVRMKETMSIRLNMGMVYLSGRMVLAIKDFSRMVI